MTDEFQKFLGEEGVKPLKVERRVSLAKKDDRDASEDRRRRAAVEEAARSDPLSTMPETMLEPFDFLSFQRPGVQHGVFKNLRLGRYQIDATLDLHRMSVEQARTALWQFINDCVNHDVRSALILHGTGEKRETPALLKSCVAHWLPQLDVVLAFHTAQKQHGSYGATYVLLRKSEKKKNETRGKFGKRGSAETEY